MNILFVGDIFGAPGRRALRRFLPEIRAEFPVDIIVVNAENAAGGLGATPEILDELFGYGVQAITMGNHTWRKRALVGAIGRYTRVVRPANYPNGAPGTGSAVIELEDGRRMGLVNVLGRVFMEAMECPFETAGRAVTRLREQTPVVLVDMHAEATSEKIAMGWHLDGKCSAVVCTHTHVQTADERVLPAGTAYITDVGMTGPRDGVIGVDRERIIEKFLTGMPTEFQVSKTTPMLNAVYIEVDDESGTAHSITRIQRIMDETGSN